jgi:hypothetical protein
MKTEHVFPCIYRNIHNIEKIQTIIVVHSFSFLIQSLPNSLFANSLHLFIPMFAHIFLAKTLIPPYSLLHLLSSRALLSLRALTSLTKFSSVSQPLASGLSKVSMYSYYCSTFVTRYVLVYLAIIRLLTYITCSYICRCLHFWHI